MEDISILNSDRSTNMSEQPEAATDLMPMLRFHLNEIRSAIDHLANVLAEMKPSASDERGGLR